MVSKLRLKKFPHPCPYKVSWLSKEQQDLVSDQVWVDFQIVEYRDKILCDVVEMDACHLLLGRPWQYNLDSRHDGKKNVYKLTKDDVQYTMTPLPDDGKKNHVVTSVMLVGKENFMQTIKEKDTPCFSIVVKPREEVRKKEEDKVQEMFAGPKEVKELLEKYKGIVAGRKPETLPPFRDVSRCIDLIPGSSLPNKVEYKLTPDQNEELARQVHELLEKGFIRTSISPCVVPAVLALEKEELGLQLCLTDTVLQFALPKNLALDNLAVSSYAKLTGQSLSEE
ncbi:uncharacterized protein LOC131856955 [Cryptomeria japonica]|uniref:uncharacterized protein LOC131856955 n=1 Tax=Cryptomeria japonica TaxID=3369 RepID=UPI0027DA65A4|nr:uncharacterized protein LOC131856955 [Cryptomeria japonica]